MDSISENDGDSASMNFSQTSSGATVNDPRVIEISNLLISRAQRNQKYGHMSGRGGLQSSCSFRFCHCVLIGAEPSSGRIDRFLSKVYSKGYDESKFITSSSPKCAEKLLDTIQMIIDCQKSDHETRTYPELQQHLRLMRAVIKVHHVLPSSIFLRNIQRHGITQVAGGRFSDIYRTTSSRGNRVCVKRLRSFSREESNSFHSVVEETVYQEAFIWRQIDHPHILPFLGVNDTLFSGSICLISPYMANGNVNAFLQSHPDFNRVEMIVQVASGLHYLHELFLCHGDIRGANILVNEDQQCVLGDFGLTSLVDATSHQGPGCLRWMAPEVLSYSEAPMNKNTLKRDVYAFGCTVLEIFTQRIPFFETKSDDGARIQILNGTPPATEQPVEIVSHSLWSLLQECWELDPNSRPSAQYIYSILQICTN